MNILVGIRLVSLQFICVQNVYFTFLGERDGILSSPSGDLSECVSPRIIDECSERVSEVMCMSPNTGSPASFAKKRGSMLLIREVTGIELENVP